ncbi:hypothetical protein [Sphingobium sp. Ant17]|uniref:hypothetical protein n=1 Tax=Sphingobium sp. Ant17 TaxID=1461752 RepID=UPI00044B7329|nr:hypothetical protein [Sphingobium sp. Ant17]EXS70536.1 hypothetical protein BF95_16055 [Sphingobium sp. Ant17]
MDAGSSPAWLQVVGSRRSTKSEFDANHADVSEPLEHIVAFIFGAGVSIALAIYACIAVKERKVYWRNFIDTPWIYRDARPFAFWFAIGFYCFLAGAFALICISGLTS